MCHIIHLRCSGCSHLQHQMTRTTDEKHDSTHTHAKYLRNCVQHHRSCWLQLSDTEPQYAAIIDKSTS
jgi:hypothetical protein